MLAAKANALREQLNALAGQAPEVVVEQTARLAADFMNAYVHEHAPVDWGLPTAYHPPPYAAPNPERVWDDAEFERQLSDPNATRTLRTHF